MTITDDNLGHEDIAQETVILDRLHAATTDPTDDRTPGPDWLDAVRGTARRRPAPAGRASERKRLVTVLEDADYDVSA